MTLKIGTTFTVRDEPIVEKAEQKLGPLIGFRGYVNYTDGLRVSFVIERNLYVDDPRRGRRGRIPSHHGCCETGQFGHFFRIDGHNTMVHRVFRNADDIWPNVFNS